MEVGAAQIPVEEEAGRWPGLTFPEEPVSFTPISASQAEWIISAAEFKTGWKKKARKASSRNSAPGREFGK
ncbi:hypothetical protein Cadr_000004045 [Camelus dromedarius]|uniref:Uncharacterized protein n=1 Tax=Camelus dromedarius TaxID=9838 RepID=A0A5N4EB87_CAMDR|nr:hypothetical protein Cadr_000004045 [Camelus dromedarius]